VFLESTFFLAALSRRLKMTFNLVLASSAFLAVIEARKPLMFFLRSVLISRLCKCLVRFCLNALCPDFLVGTKYSL